MEQQINEGNRIPKRMRFFIADREVIEYKILPPDKMLDTGDGKLYVPHIFPLVLAVSDIDTAVQVASHFAIKRIHESIDYNNNQTSQK